MQQHVVIGGSGFIGTRLCQRLVDEGLPFRIFDKIPSRTFPEDTVVVDVRDRDALLAAMPEGAIVYLLAAEHRDDVAPKRLYREVNVDGARNVADAAAQRNVRRIVFTSSVAVYGFAPIGTGEDGTINPFNDYGRTKYEAEAVLRAWQAADPGRCLSIVRPTVVFGERNRGNVYNLLRQIASGRFVMIGTGTNRKSMAYVDNVAAFLQFCTKQTKPLAIINYVDKPDFTMNALVEKVRGLLGRPPNVRLRLPKMVGLLAGFGFDAVAAITRRRLAISSIRVRKFCADSVYGSALGSTGFVPPVTLDDALSRTVRFEFIDRPAHDLVFETE